MRSASVCLTFVLFLIVPSAAAEITGVWTGTYSITIAACQGNSVSSSGPAAFFVIGHAEGFTGFINLQNVTVPLDCSPGPQLPVSLLVAGQVNGSSVTAEVTLPSLEEASLTGTLNGTSLNATFGGQDASGTLALTQTSTQAPSTLLSGSYMGTYTAEEDVSGECANMSKLTYSGPLQMTIFNVGRGAAAYGSLDNAKEVRSDNRVCTVVEGVSFPFYLSIAIGEEGRFVALGATASDEEIVVINGTLSGNSFSGLLEDDRDKFTFTATKTEGTPPPVVTSFRAEPQQITAGSSSTLTWTTANATSVTIDNGVGSHPPNGSATVTPQQTTIYKLTATGPGGTAGSAVQVFVAPAAAPRIALSSEPPRIVQRAGQAGGSGSFTLSNIGSAPADLTLTANGGFFNVSPSSVEIPPRSSQRFEVTGTAQPAGVHRGSVAVAGGGIREGAEIPVFMLSAPPTSGVVLPRALISRAEISTAIGEARSGTVPFTNIGTGTLAAMAVSDVPWLSMEDGLISIAPGETKFITFSIDPTKRPQETPIGALAGKVSIVFFRDANNAHAPSILSNGTNTASVSVTLVHVVRPGVVPGAPPPLAPGELALFVPGLANKPTASGDLYVANTAASAISDLKLYLLGFGGVAQNAALPALQSNTTVAMPGVVKNIFASPVATGTTQIRSSNLASVSVTATQTNTSWPAGTLSTALPVFRSDRGMATGGRIFLSGLLKSSTARTDLFVQEVSGNNGTFQVEFLDGAGSVMAALSPQSVSPFGFVELADLTPAGAAAARITNTSPGAARISAYALVSNTVTSDAWLSTDPATDDATADTLIAPLFSAGTGAETALHMTNRTSSPANVTVDIRSAMPSRRRAAGRVMTGSGPTAVASATTSVTLAAGQTTTTPIDQSSGYLRLTVPPGAISAVARSVRNGSAAGETFGTGLRAVPNTLALSAGQMKRFSAVDDSSAGTRAAQTPATFRTNLALVETTNQSATVRVTLSFSFSASALVTANATSAKEYVLSPSGYRLISDLARDVIGEQRDSFGDLRNITVDVEVIGGPGRVLPFLQSIDNGSGDSIVRIE